MNTKFFLLLALSLLISNTVSSGALRDRHPRSILEVGLIATVVRPLAPAPGEDVFPNDEPPTDHHNDHEVKKHIHHEEDGKHEHHTSSGRFGRRRRWACLTCKVLIAFSYLLSFCYCFEHATHMSLGHFLNACYKTVVFFQHAIS